MRRLSRVARVVAATAGLSLVLGGCDLLLPGFYGDPDPFDPGLSATYEAGRATVELDVDGEKDTLELNDLVEGSELTGFGATATWRNADGWALTLATYDMGMPGLPGTTGDITIQRINGTELWTTDSYSSPNSCIIDIQKVSADELVGTATCRGLRWVDGVGGMGWSAGGPRYVEGEPEFDVTITFEARPAVGANG